MKKVFLINLFVILILAVSSVNAQFPSIKKTIKDSIKKTEKKSDQNNKQNKDNNTDRNDSSVIDNSGNSSTNNKSNSKKSNHEVIDGITYNNIGEDGSYESMFGRLVFSNQPIDPNNPANLKTNFTAGESIYGLLILNKPLREFVNTGEFNNIGDPRSPTIIVRIIPDNNFGTGIEHKYKFEVKGDVSLIPSDKYFIFDISPAPDKQRTYSYDNLTVGRYPRGYYGDLKEGPIYYSAILADLKPGKHTFNVEIEGFGDMKIRENYRNEGVAFIRGSFSIDGTDYSFYKKRIDELKTAGSSNEKMPEPQWNDPQVIAGIKTAFNKAGNREKILRVVIINQSWVVQREFGNIVHRRLIAFVATQGAGGKCYKEKANFKQYYRNGNYQPTVKEAIEDARVLIPCKNIN